MPSPIEYAFWSKWTVRAEYLYISLNDSTVTLPAPPFPAASAYQYWQIYFSESEIVWNVLLSFEPMALTLAMITTEMPAAMRPYSIAVAPVSSLKNATSFDMWSLQVHLCSRGR